MNRIGIRATVVWGACSLAMAGAPSFTAPPVVSKVGGNYTIRFAISEPTDVEVAILAGSNVVRHLAAGVLGGAKAPPEPLTPGLAQSLTWDGNDDFGKPAVGAPFRFRARAGFGIKFDRMIGSDPYNFGNIDGLAADEDGNVYIIGSSGEANQGHMVVRVFDPQGRYLREVVPFPADLPPGAMKDVARWDAERRTFFPRNLRNVNPDFYGTPSGMWGNTSLTLVSVSRKNGVLFSDGGRFCVLEENGSVRNATFKAYDFGNIGNSALGPNFAALSPDGKYAYLSGPYTAHDGYGHESEPAFPPGRIYRAALAGGAKFKEFVTIPVAHSNGLGGAWFKACSNTTHFGVPKGPVHQVAVDGKGQVYVANREAGCVTVFDESGKEIGKVALKNPHLVAVHPKTGAIYVTQLDCLSYGKFQCVLNRFDNFKEGAVPAARLEFPPGTDGVNSRQCMALSVGADKTIVWMAGVKGGLVSLLDKGTAFEPFDNQFGPKRDVPGDWNRLATDFERDEIYVSNGSTRMWRFSGRTGEGGVLRKDGREFLVNDLAVGYDGLLYARVSGAWDRSAGAYSGPFWRLDHELNAAPYAGTGTQVLSKYIYSRFGVGFAERGIGVGADGKVYISFLYDCPWVYAVAGFGPDGKPMQGKYLKGVFPAKRADERKRYPADLDSAIVGPVPQANSGIRVDRKGNLYIGILYRPKGFPVPKGFEQDQAYRVAVGSVVRFSPEGGFMPGKEDAMRADQLEGAEMVYPGFAPFSSSIECMARNTCCVCRTGRFDLDRYGRVVIPNAFTDSVLLYDNAGNLIAEFGKYGNFDSLHINQNTEAGKAGKPTVAVPEIPLAWPTAAGFSEDHIYVNDTCNRRVVRTDISYQCESSGMIN